MNTRIDIHEAGEPVPFGKDQDLQVKHFRQIVLWPLYLMPAKPGTDVQSHWEALATAGPDNPWRELQDEFTNDPSQFQNRHYNEFVAFLPPVQRFLYGQGCASTPGVGEYPIRVMRRCDIAKVRVTFLNGATPFLFDVAHVDLYFFFDIDVAMLVFEIRANEMPLSVAQDTMFQFGRAYPGYWDKDGHPGHCPWRVEWLGADGAVLAVSDYENRQKYLASVCRHRAPAVAAHWEYMLQPLALHHTQQPGPIRYRQLEYYRMPLMAFLAIDKPQRLTETMAAHLAVAGGSGSDQNTGPNAVHYGTDERRRFGTICEVQDPETANVRYLSCGHAFVVVGDANNTLFTDCEHGHLARFRHQHFLLFLVAHFHKASLLMFSDRLAAAVGRLNVNEVSAVSTFRHDTRRALETFLRFTHRYWFDEVSDHMQMHDLFDICRRPLGIDRLYASIRQEVQDMSQYLENDAMRRQNETVMRLTVVTVFGLIGTLVTGFLGMNIFSWGDETPITKFLLFMVVFVPSVLITLYTVRSSRQLAGFLEALSKRADPMSK